MERNPEPDRHVRSGRSRKESIEAGVRTYETTQGGLWRKARAAIRELGPGLWILIVAVLWRAWSSARFESNIEAGEPGPAPADEILLAEVGEAETSPTPAEGATAKPEASEAADSPVEELVHVPDPVLSRLPNYLRQAEEDTNRKDDELRSQQAEVDSQRRKVFALLFLAGAATLLLALVGVVLVLTGNVGPGVVSAAIAVLPAAGTAILFRLSADLQGTRRELESRRTHNEGALRALQAIDAIDDPEERRRQFGLHVEGVVRKAHRGAHSR